MSHDRNEIAKASSESHKDDSARHALSNEFTKPGAHKSNTMASDAETQAGGVLSNLKLYLDASIAQETRDERSGLHPRDPSVEGNIWNDTPAKYDTHSLKGDVPIDSAYKKMVLKDISQMSGQYGLSISFTDVFGDPSSSSTNIFEAKARPRQ